MKRFLLVSTLIVSFMSAALYGQGPDAAGGQAEKPKAGRSQNPGDAARAERLKQAEARRGAMQQRFNRVGPGASQLLNLRKMDTNNDRIISEEEIDAAMPDIANQIKETQALILKVFDKDGDGVLSESEQAEMKEVATALNTMQMLQSFDKNADMLLDDEEIQGIRQVLVERATRMNQFTQRRLESVKDGNPGAEGATAGPGANPRRIDRQRQGEVRVQEKDDDDAMDADDGE